MLRRLCTPVALAALMAVAAPASVALAAPGQGKAGTDAKMDATLQERAQRAGWSRVIVTFQPGAADAISEIIKLGGRFGRPLSLIDGQVIELPNGQLKKLAKHPAVLRLDHDRPTEGTLTRVKLSVGGQAVQNRLGYDGAGVGVALIDSGITTWHDDLTYTGTSPNVIVTGGQRVSAFVDFVNGAAMPYDDNGHGTHVAGIVAGNGYDSAGVRDGIAPAAHLVSLKVLDREGRGVISDVIAALDYAVTNRAAHNIRVINISVGARVTGSYNVDPLALAAKKAVEAGIVVVAAAGNVGERAGSRVYGGIVAPGNAPWVVTVGASNDNGTPTRRDDTVAPYSSRGPSAYDYIAKPDLVAPGTGVVSLSAPGSLFYETKASALVSGTTSSTKPYLSLSGTSMAAPVVTGTIALMMQANPSLTPNLVKAILQYTAERRGGIDLLSQGAGFLNTYGAVTLARHYRVAAAGDPHPYDRNWGRAVHWGNRLVRNGAMSPAANAWELGTVWGSARDAEGDNIVWGTLSREGDNIVWGTAREGDNIVWGTVAEDFFNIVWGTMCGGDDCFNIVWGTAREGDNIVWGTLLGEGDNIVWGTLFAVEGDNIVWGTLADADGLFNIVWGTSGDLLSSITGTALGEGDNIVWGTVLESVVYSDPTTSGIMFEDLFESPPPPTTTTTSSGGSTGTLSGLLGGGL